MALGIVVALLGAAVYQSVAVAFSRDESAVVMPDAGHMLADLEAPAPAALASASPAIDVNVDITWRARLRSLPPAPVCRLLAGDQESVARVAWLAGSACLPLQRVHDGDAQLISVAVHGQDTLRLVRVRAGGVTLRVGGRVALRGAVVDTDGNGVAAARVWAAGAETTTAADGTFAIEAVGGEGLPMVAMAAGMAAQTVVIDAWSDSTVRFVLQPSAPLRVRVVGALPAGGEPAQVFVLPSGEPRTSAEAQYPFFLQALHGGVPVARNGIAVLHHLPVGACVRLRLSHGQVVAEDRPLVEVRARPTETTLVAEAGATVRGKVAAVDGTPGGSALLVTWPDADGDELVRGPAAASALPALAYSGRGAVAHAAADGTFCIARSTRYAASRLLAIGTGAWAAEVVVTGTAGVLEYDMVLPALLPEHGALAQPEVAALALHALLPGNYRVRIHERGAAPRPVAAWTGAAPFKIPLRAAALADVKVSVGAGDSQRQRMLPALTIVDAVAVQLPPAQR